MCEEEPVYNDKPIKVWSPVYDLPELGFVILRKGFVWRNLLFESIDQGMLQLRFAYPKDHLTLDGTTVHRYRNGDYQFIGVKLVKST
jgi:hypothetical protein